MDQEEKIQTEVEEKNLFSSSAKASEYEEIDLMDYVHPVRSPWQKKFLKFFLLCDSGV